MCVSLRAVTEKGNDRGLQPDTFTICAGRHNTLGKLAKVVGVMAFAGFTAGLLGIGGALIFNPVLLQLGVHPQVRILGCQFFNCLRVQDLGMHFGTAVSQSNHFASTAS